MALCIIPARWNSSRFPGKLLSSVQGKTILERTYQSALQSSLLDSIYIATDDLRIQEHAHSFGANVLWTSSVCRNGTERIIETLQRNPHLRQFPYLLNIQGDHPCVSKETIESVLSALEANPQVSVVTAACPISCLEEFNSSHIVKCVVNSKGIALYFSRSPIPYIRNSSSIPSEALQHVGIYGFRTSFLLDLPPFLSTSLQRLEDLEQLAWLELGYLIQVVILKEPAVAIDTPQDLLKLEQLLCQSNTYS